MGEYLRWTTTIGQYKVPSCMTLLVDDLEAHGMVPLPAKQVKQAPGQPIPAFQKPPATPPLTDTLTAVAPITTGDIKGGARVLDSLSPTYHLCGRTFNLSVQPQELVSRAAAVGSAPSLSVSQSKAHS